ncbi:MAG: 1,4-dihydroxy-6-naphthoate synthase [Desulfovibrionaceae bacterium]
MTQTLTLGISPCPNDTYIFHALVKKLVPVPCNFTVHMADVEELNALAVAGTLDISKISTGVVPHIAHSYALLAAGGALGWGCGPLVVARQAMSAEKLQQARIAIPGRMTTANLLLDLHGGFRGERVEMLFDAVMPAVIRGDVDCGLIIHEGRFTYADYGLVRVFDTGAWWEHSFAVPLPLGVIVARRDVDKNVALAVQRSIRDSVLYARAHPEACADYVREHAQEMDPAVTSQHIATFVTEYSVDLGVQGCAAVEKLVRHGARNAALQTPLPPLFL